MYQHGYRHFSIDSAERPLKDEVMAKEQNKRRMSFIKKFMGGKEKEGGGRGGEKA